MIYDNLNLNINNNNKYISIYGCTDDYISCLVGCFFPYCLFGDTYKKSKFGNCLTGCCKMFSLQFLLSSLFFVLYLHFEYNTIYLNENKYLTNIDKCHNIKLCDNNSVLEDEIKLISEPCLINNTTKFVCGCLKNSLVDYCSFKTDKLPELINELTLLTIMLNMIHLLTLSIMMGIFSGYYRKKLSYRLNIIEKSKYPFCIHFCPITHLLALCQENNTVKNIYVSDNNDYVRPIDVIDVKNRSEALFMA